MHIIITTIIVINFVVVSVVDAISINVVAIIVIVDATVIFDSNGGDVDDVAFVVFAATTAVTIDNKDEDV